MLVSCSNIAYEKIINSKLRNILFNKRDTLQDIVLFRDFYKFNHIFCEAKKSVFNKDRGISERSESSKNIFLLDQEIKENQEMYKDIKELLAKYYSFLPRVILGEQVFSPEKFGFFSTTSLEKALTGFILGQEDFFESRENYSWRNKVNETKNTISLSLHGDWFVSQSKTPSKLEETFFGETFDSLIIDEDSKGFSIYQDTSNFLISTLRYAMHLGKEKSPDILKWKEVLEEEGFVGTATTEALMGSDDLSRLIIADKLKGDIFTSDKKVDSYPLTIYGVNYSSKGVNCTYPYFEGENFCFLKNSPSGEISFKSNLRENDFCLERYSKSVEYTKEDLPHLLRASYRLFSRQRSLLPVIMEEFISLTKK